MKKGTTYVVIKVRPIKISVEYVGTNMGIQVPLLVIDQRHVSVRSTLFSNRRVCTLNVTMTVIMSLCILMYRRLFGVPDMITDMTRSLEMVET